MTVEHALVIGAMKAGTTSVYSDLTAVPGVDLFPKEHGRFLHSSTPPELPISDRVSVEVCAEYSMRDSAPGVPSRVADSLGTETAIVYLVRDPFDRLTSHLRHLSSLGHDLTELTSNLSRKSAAVQSSLYGHQAEAWTEAGFSNIVLVDFHRYMAARSKGLADLLGILGVERPPELDRIDFGRQNASDDLRSARGFIRPIVRSKSYGALKRVIPARARRVLKSTALTKGAEQTVELPVETQAELANLFEQDRKHLAALGLSVPPWLGDEPTAPSRGGTT